MRKLSWKWISLHNRTVPGPQLVEGTVALCTNKDEMLRTQGASDLPLVFSIDSISLGGRVILRKCCDKKTVFIILYWIGNKCQCRPKSKCSASFLTKYKLGLLWNYSECSLYVFKGSGALNADFFSKNKFTFLLFCLFSSIWIKCIQLDD